MNKLIIFTLMTLKNWKENNNNNNNSSKKKNSMFSIILRNINKCFSFFSVGRVSFNSRSSLTN